MKDIKLIALDLDGTLLRNDKSMSERTRRTLQAANDKGVYIVPTTGRYFGAMPEVVRKLPFLRYVISVNGAQVADMLTGEVIYKAEIPVEKAVAIMRYMDTLPVIYDAYIQNDGYITRDMQEHTEQYVHDAHYTNMVRKFRKPVEELKAYIRERGDPIQKTQMLTPDLDVRKLAFAEIPKRFDGLAVSSSFSGNVEINDEHANKGEAMLALAKHLGLSPEQTMAFGDGLNDVSMIKCAGLGVAMINGSPEPKAAADYITISNEEDGVAAAIEKLVL